MTSYDQLEIRCPRLGGEIQFSYCACEGGDLPCAMIINCWQPFFPVESYLTARMSQESWERFSRQVAKSKVTTILELVEAAKKRMRCNEQG